MRTARLRALTPANISHIQSSNINSRNEYSPIKGINMKNCSVDNSIREKAGHNPAFFDLRATERSNGCNPGCAQATTKYLSLCFGSAGYAAEFMGDLGGAQSVL